MLLRTADPFRDLDRLTQQVLGTTNRPAVMPMDAWREGDRFVIEFDLPGVNRESIDLDVERNVLTVHAERVARNGDWEMLASERPRGVFSRQLVLGDNLDLGRSRPPTTAASCAWSCRSPRGRSRARSRSSPPSPRNSRRSRPDHGGAGPRPAACAPARRAAHPPANGGSSSTVSPGRTTTVAGSRPPTGRSPTSTEHADDHVAEAPVGVPAARRAPRPAVTSGPPVDRSSSTPRHARAAAQ